MSAIISDIPGSASLPVPAGLAPMDGITDFPFRLWLACAGLPDFFVTPFVRVTEGFGFRHISPQFCPEAFSLPGLFSVPVIPQIMGPSHIDVARVAEGMLRHVPFVDINCGCPATTVFRHGAGSALLRTPELFAGFLTGLSALLGSKNFSVKMRSGIRDDEELVRLLPVLRGVEPRLVTLHPRTQKQGYGGMARWQLVEVMARALEIPVWGSGDVIDVASFDERLRQAPGAKGVMIGRGALADPWIFLKLRKADAQVSPACLAKALLCFFLVLHACEKSDEDAFLAAEIVRGSSCETHPDAWEDLARRLCEGVFHHSINDVLISCGTRTLPRLKQLTKFLTHSSVARSKPILLRATLTQDFFQHLFTECGLPFGPG